MSHICDTQLLVMGDCLLAAHRHKMNLDFLWIEIVSSREYTVANKLICSTNYACICVHYYMLITFTELDCLNHLIGVELNW